MIESFAKAAQAKAYAPYSKFKVGAAVRMSGQIFEGANVENASYPLSVCAERNAIANAIIGGATELEEVCVYTDASPPASPCGGCRQWLAEMQVERVVFRNGGRLVQMTVDELLPEQFDAGDLA